MSNERWEYKVIVAPLSLWGASKPEQLTEVLNREGLQNWELVSVAQHGTRLHCFLKRQR